MKHEDSEEIWFLGASAGKFAWSRRRREICRGPSEHPRWRMRASPKNYISERKVSSFKF